MSEVAVKETVLWSIEVSRETDSAVRTLLGEQGLERGELARFIEDAVRRQVFHRVVDDIKAHNASADPEELQSIIDDAVMEVRKGKHPAGA